MSLVAYRVNSDSTSSSYNKMERLGKGLVWNGVSTTDTPVVFMPLLLLGDLWQSCHPEPRRLRRAARDIDTGYEMIGPQVFRFEYCYLLHGR